MKLGATELKVDGNVLSGKFSTPFIPPSKIEQKDNYLSYNLSITVEPLRLFQMYKILNNALKGEFLDTIFFLYERTDKNHYVSIIPKSLISEKYRKIGVVIGINFYKKTDNKIHSGRALLTLPLIATLRNEIRQNGKMQLPFAEIDENGKPHIVILERDKNQIKTIFPLEVQLSENKKNKLQLSLEMLLSGEEKIPTTVVGNKLVFRKANTGNFVVHTPHHDVKLTKENIKDLYLLVNN